MYTPTQVRSQKAQRYLERLVEMVWRINSNTKQCLYELLGYWGNCKMFMYLYECELLVPFSNQMSLFH